MDGHHHHIGRKGFVLEWTRGPPRQRYSRISLPIYQYRPCLLPRPISSSGVKEYANRSVLHLWVLHEISGHIHDFRDTSPCCRHPSSVVPSEVMMSLPTLVLRQLRMLLKDRCEHHGFAGQLDNA